MKLSVEVDGVEILVDSLEDGLEDGMEDAVDKILDHLEREAKNTIAVKPSVFTGQVYESFEDQTGNADSKKGISSRFINSAKHAGALEHGVHSSKYADGGPPISALMPWVIEKLSDWNIEESDGSGGTGGSAVQTPTRTPEDDDISDHKDEDAFSNYEEDWTRFHENGFTAEELYYGQDVVVHKNGEYKSGTVVEIKLDKFNRQIAVVKDSDGVTREYNIAVAKGTGDSIVVGSDWNSLDDSTKRDIIKTQLADIAIDSSFSSSFKGDIEDAFQLWGDKSKNLENVKKFSLYIKKVEKKANASFTGRWKSNSRTILFDTTTADRTTIIHEQTHAYADANGMDYVEGARGDYTQSGGNNWDTTDLHGVNPISWDYDSRGEDDWETEKSKNFPHPTTYMLHDEGTREGVGPFDDVDHPAFDHWQEYVRKDTKSNLQHVDDAGPPDYDPYFTERRALDPDGGPASEGDAIAVELTGKSGSSKVFHFKVESSVYEREEDGNTIYEIEVSNENGTATYEITSDGTFAHDRISFEGFLIGGADDLEASESSIIDPENVPDDPGFFAPTEQTFARFVEGLNRHQWREMLAAELGDFKQQPKFFMRNDGYSGINTHEVFAHFMPLIFNDGNNNSNEDHLIDLLETDPELIYAASMEFDFTQEMIDVLEKETGMDFEDLLMDIHRTNINDYSS